MFFTSIAVRSKLLTCQVENMIIGRFNHIFLYLMEILKPPINWVNFAVKIRCKKLLYLFFSICAGYRWAGISASPCRNNSGCQARRRNDAHAGHGDMRWGCWFALFVVLSIYFTAKYAKGAKILREYSKTSMIAFGFLHI